VTIELQHRAQVTVAHLLAPAAFGGLERVVTGLALAMAARGLRVVLILVMEPDQDEPAWAIALRDRGVIVESVFVKRRAFAEERAHVSDLVDRHGVTIVHIHGERPAVINGPMLVRAGLGVILTLHGFTRSGLRQWIRTRLLRHAVRSFHAVVAVSAPLRALLCEMGFNEKQVTVISNGFSPSLASPRSRSEARIALGLPSEARVVGWIGRASQEKGLDVMVSSLATLSPDVICCIIGDGPMLAQATSLATRLGVQGRVRFLGARPDAASFLGAFDVLALSSRTEGTPMVLLEAAEEGIPVVATSVGGVPDLLGSDGGVMVPPDDPNALGAALERVLHDMPSARARAAALKTRLTASHQSASWIDEHIHMYERVISRRSEVVR
jgi:glycosyltransferase involved in cell wall biosynthesis